jgi:hypothetical protein
MSVSIKIVDSDKEFEAVRVRLGGFEGLAARAGLFDPIEAAKGFWHEFGRGVPARPWMGPASDAAQERAGAEAEKAVIRVLNGAATAEDGLDEIGHIFAEAQRSIIEDGRVGGPPLSERAKRNDPRKLIDSGDMVDSIESRVGPDRGDT